jgi:hypothetical protein
MEGVNAVMITFIGKRDAGATKFLTGLSSPGREKRSKEDVRLAVSVGKPT